MCALMFVCVFPHPWTASSAWSAWSAYPPQPPCLQSSRWWHVCMLKSVSVCHVFGRLERAHTRSFAFFPLLILLPLSLSLTLPPLSAEPLFLSSLLSGFLTPSHGAPPPPPPRSLSLSLLFLPTLSHILFLPPSNFLVFSFGVVASLPPSPTNQEPGRRHW